MVSRCVASIVCLQLGRWPITPLIFCQLPLRNFITADDDLNQSKINSVYSYTKFNFFFFCHTWSDNAVYYSNLASVHLCSNLILNI